MDSSKRLEQCKAFIDEHLEPQIMKFDRVLYVLQKDLADIMNDTTLIAEATESMVSMVVEFFKRAEETKAQIQKDAVAAQEELYANKMRAKQMKEDAEKQQ